MTDHEDAVDRLVGRIMRFERERDAAAHGMRNAAKRLLADLDARRHEQLWFRISEQFYQVHGEGLRADAAMSELRRARDALAALQAEHGGADEQEGAVS